MEIKGALQEDWCTRQGLERGGKCRERSGPQKAEKEPERKLWLEQEEPGMASRR